MVFKDHFSGHAAEYTTYRPCYPRGLYAWLATLVPAESRVWDCATGNGQAALGLAEFFAEVVATDASASQIDASKPHPRVSYRVAPAEASGLRDHSVALVTVGQALHWFDFEVFYREVRRVLQPGGVLAAWSYGLMTVSPAVDAVVQRLYGEIIGPYWPPERHLVEQRYRDLPFPLDEFDAPDFAMQTEWTLPQLVGYLGTWSAVQRYRKSNSSDPLALVTDELSQAWGDAAVKRTITWPLFMRVGRI